MTRVTPRSGTAPPAPAQASSTLSAGMKLGRYELLHPIASGGMAQVWAAEQAGDLGFRKLIALKTIRPDFAFDPTFRSMFLDEARLASRIRHANVVEVLDLGAEGSVVYQAMTFIEGAPLSAWLNKAGANRVPLGAGLRVAIDMLRGLHAAHELCDDEGKLLGLVHRDVSPQNVLIGLDGIAKLADFGIAKAFGRSTEETSYGDVKGKLGYVAPELLEGFPASSQSDLFSAGVVLWEVLTGRRLFKIRAGEDTIGARQRMSDYDPREVVPNLSPRLAAIAMTALERDPYARFRSSLEMADALEEVIRLEGIDATHRHVAAALAEDLGPVIGDLRETIRLARRGSHGAAVVPAPPPPPAPAASDIPIDVTVGPTVTGAGSGSVDGRSAPIPASGASHGSAILVATALFLAAISIIGAVLLWRSRDATSDRAPPDLGTASNLDVGSGAAAAPPPASDPATLELDSPAGSPSSPAVLTPSSFPAVRVPAPGGPRSQPHGRRPSAPAGASGVPTAAAPRFESPY